MKVSSYIAKFIKSKGINTVFELQGGMITRIIDAFHQEKDIEIVSVHHEQAAAMAVDAYARLTNKPGIALATSGPGAINLLTGIGNCYFDSVPAIFITGQVNLNEQKGDKPIRQLGFQETDIIAMATPITKKVYAIKTIEEIPTVFQEAYQVAMSGRQGPVLIDIPMNFQHQEIEENSFQVIDNQLNSRKEEIEKFFSKYKKALQESKRPLILVGRGIRASASVSSFEKFIQNFKIPVVSSLLGLDVIPYENPLRVGFIGTYGNRWANYALGSCDLLLVLGSRLDLRQTGANTEIFKENKKIFHIDIDACELNNRILDCEVLEADLSEFFLYANEGEYETPKEWLTEIQKKRAERLDTHELENVKGINPNVFIHLLSEKSKLAKVFTTDVGNNQMWCAQSLELSKNQQFLSSGGMGAMGYSLPAAIGASITLKNEPIVCFSGDGGFQINIQELQTISRNRLPIKIVILNNRCLGMIRQFQDSYFDSCYQSTVWGYSAPDFTQVAKAYAIDAFSIEKEEEIEEGLEKMWQNPTSPFLLNVYIDIHTNVYPKMMFGSPLTQMEPIIK